ncbi:MAG: hypothetical protein LQ351_004421 [Letrouitia transgressa]|nr:MAG: hypothetical protein LQ351_004421 [Letrouitia transgressa]
MLVQSPPKGIIFDLGDVLLTWSPNTSTKISAQLMRKILSSTIWSEYECGYLEQDVCYDQIAQYFSVSAFEVADAFAQARGSLQPNHALIAVIRHLKRQFEGVMEIYAMSNISKEDFAILSKTKIFEWSSVFDQVFVSGHVGMRKPDPEFYRHVLLGTNLAPQETLFIDDKTENVLAAKSLGIDSIMFNNNISVIHALRSLLNDPTGRAFEFLYHRQRPFNSVTDTGIDIPDNFAQLLLLDTMQDQYILHLTYLFLSCY